MKIGIVFFLVVLTISHGYKILFLVPFNGPSHWIFLQNIVKELVKRGHEVTAISNSPVQGLKSSNYTQVLIDPPLNLKTFMSAEKIFQGKFESDFNNVDMYTDLGLMASRHALNTLNVQKIVHSNNLDFDLVINEEFFTESWLMFAHKFNAPIVTISTSTYGNSDFFDRAMGLLTPWSHVAHMLLPYRDSMSFSERFYNVFLSTYDWIHRNWVVLPDQNRIAKKYFGHLEKNGAPLPSVDELYRSISIILVNSHRSISPPRPVMPGIINIAGATIKPPKALPSDLQEFLDNSKNGVIYFTIGSFMHSASMPKDKIATFLETFGKLSQNVLWKFENESLTNVPSNVMIRKWMPQTDILAHKNVILFMSHGGLFGNFEGIAHGVPMLFTPLYGDQHRNALLAVSLGYGRMLPFKDITGKSLMANLHEMLTNNTYLKRAKELASVFNDNIVHPMDEAMYWIEYVCRHKGAKHLKSHAVNMSWFSYLLLDVLSTVLLGAVIMCLLFWMIKVICSGKKSTKPEENGKKKTQ